MKLSQLTAVNALGFSSKSKEVALIQSCVISTTTFYKWRSKLGGMGASLMPCLKELEDKNLRIKKRYREEQI
jgi:hypothetical protein